MFYYNEILLCDSDLRCLTMCFVCVCLFSYCHCSSLFCCYYHCCLCCWYYYLHSGGCKWGKNCTAATLRLCTPPLRQLLQWSFPAPLITAEFVTRYNFHTGVCMCVSPRKIKCHHPTRLIWLFLFLLCLMTMPAAGTGRTLTIGSAVLLLRAEEAS